MINPEEHIKLCQSTVHKMIKKYPILKTYEMEDLFSISYLEMVKAAKRFDKSKGYRFSTFAVTCITGAILNLINREKNADIRFLRNGNSFAVVFFG